jgi:hypothetical protein
VTLPGSRIVLEIGPSAFQQFRIKVTSGVGASCSARRSGPRQQPGGASRKGEPVGGHERAQDVVVDLGVDVGEQQPVAGEGVAVAPGNPPDQAVAGEPG